MCWDFICTFVFICSAVALLQLRLFEVGEVRMAIMLEAGGEDENENRDDGTEGRSLKDEVAEGEGVRLYSRWSPCQSSDMCKFWSSAYECLQSKMLHLLQGRTANPEPNVLPTSWSQVSTRNRTPLFLKG